MGAGWREEWCDYTPLYVSSLPAVAQTSLLFIFGDIPATMLAYYSQSRPSAALACRNRPSATAWHKTTFRRITLIRAESADYCELRHYDVPDMEKRKTMNAILLGAIAMPTAQMAYVYLSALVPAK